MIFVRDVFDHNSGSSISFNLKLLIEIIHALIVYHNLNFPLLF